MNRASTVSYNRNYNTRLKCCIGAGFSGLNFKKNSLLLLSCFYHFEGCKWGCFIWFLGVKNGDVMGVVKALSNKKNTSPPPPSP